MRALVISSRSIHRGCGLRHGPRESVKFNGPMLSSQKSEGRNQKTEAK